MSASGDMTQTQTELAARIEAFDSARREELLRTIVDRFEKLHERVKSIFDPHTRSALDAYEKNKDFDLLFSTLYPLLRRAELQNALLLHCLKLPDEAMPTLAAIYGFFNRGLLTDEEAALSSWSLVFAAQSQFIPLGVC